MKGVTQVEVVRLFGKWASILKLSFSGRACHRPPLSKYSQITCGGGGEEEGRKVCKGEEEGMDVGEGGMNRGEGGTEGRRERGREREGERKEIAPKAAYLFMFVLQPEYVSHHLQPPNHVSTAEGRRGRRRTGARGGGGDGEIVIAVTEKQPTAYLGLLRCRQENSKNTTYSVSALNRILLFPLKCRVKQ